MSQAASTAIFLQRLAIANAAAVRGAHSSSFRPIPVL
jgi:hypothetical protein